MAWLKKDDRFSEHRKIRRLTDAQYRLHDTALHACAKDETDGRVTEDDIADMEHGSRLRKNVEALVSAKLWHEVGDAWVINDYLDYNPSHAELDEKRKQSRERQAKWRKARSEGDSEDVSQRNSGVTNAPVTRTSHPPDPTRPVPTRPVPSKHEDKTLAQPAVERQPAPSRFDEFWETYPRKVGKAKAHTKYATAAKRTSEQTIIDGATRLANDPNLPERKFIPHPTTWLERDGWEDEPMPPRTGSRRHQDDTDFWQSEMDANRALDESQTREIEQ